MRLGIHMPQKGGFKKNVLRAKSIGCDTVQIFSGNPVAWRPAKIDLEEIKNRSILLAQKDIYPLIIHASYLINLASFQEDLRNKSLELLKDTIRRAALYGAPYVVMHPGSHGGEGIKKGVILLHYMLEELAKEWPPGVMLLLENTAGGGSLLGANFEQFFGLARDFSEARLGFCLDTAHAWAAGYCLATPQGVEQLLDEINFIGCNRLHVIHANDSASEMGSRRDLHAHIGEGKIGIEGFKYLLRRNWPENLPVILETPDIGSEYDKINLERLRGCI